MNVRKLLFTLCGEEYHSFTFGMTAIAKMIGIDSNNLCICVRLKDLAQRVANGIAEAEAMRVNYEAALVSTAHSSLGITICIRDQPPCTFHR